MSSAFSIGPLFVYESVSRGKSRIYLAEESAWARDKLLEREPASEARVNSQDLTLQAVLSNEGYCQAAPWLRHSERYRW